MNGWKGYFSQIGSCRALSRIGPETSAQKQLFVGIQKPGIQSTQNQSLATRVEVGFVGSLSLGVVSTIRLPNFPEQDFCRRIVYENAVTGQNGRGDRRITSPVSRPIIHNPFEPWGFLLLYRLKTGRRAESVWFSLDLHTTRIRWLIHLESQIERVAHAV